VVDSHTGYASRWYQAPDKSRRPRDWWWKGLWMSPQATWLPRLQCCFRWRAIASSLPSRDGLTNTRRATKTGSRGSSIIFVLRWSRRKLRWPSLSPRFTRIDKWLTVGDIMKSGVHDSMGSWLWATRLAHSIRFTVRV